MREHPYFFFSVSVETLGLGDTFHLDFQEDIMGDTTGQPLDLQEPRVCLMSSPGTQCGPHHLHFLSLSSEKLSSSCQEAWDALRAEGSNLSISYIPQVEYLFVPGATC